LARAGNARFKAVSATNFSNPPRIGKLDLRGNSADFVSPAAQLRSPARLEAPE
jgi:hypothetical protein